MKNYFNLFFFLILFVIYGCGNHDSDKSVENNYQNQQYYINKIDTLIPPLITIYERLYSDVKNNSNSQNELTQFMEKISWIMPEIATKYDTSGNVVSIDILKVKEFTKWEIEPNDYKLLFNKIKQIIIYDSLIHVEQNKVIADVRFGMSKNEVEPKLEIFRKQCRKPSKEFGKDVFNYFIGNFQFLSIDENYSNGKLYGIYIIGQIIDYKDLDTKLQKQVSAIVDIIKQEYGAFSDSSLIPADYQMKEGNSYLLYKWNIGKKEIDIDITDEESYYHIDIYIFDTHIMNKINEKELLKEIDNTKSAKEVF